MKAIVEALAAISRALPGKVDISVARLPSQTWIQFDADEDDVARAIAGELGIELEDVSVPTTRWLKGDKAFDGVLVTVCGERHRIEAAELDHDALDEAAALATKAVSP